MIFLDQTRQVEFAISLRREVAICQAEIKLTFDAFLTFHTLLEMVFDRFEFARIRELAR